MILGILLIVSGTFFFLKITQVKVEGGDIYSDQQIIASAMSDKYAYHWDDTSVLYHSNDSLSTVIKKKETVFLCLL